MERMIGVQFTAEPSPENIARCSELSAKVMKTLVTRYNVTYNQILYPYADALSLSGRQGTQSTRIFGTHMLLRNVEEEMLAAAVAECGAEPFPYEVTQFPLTDGTAMSGDIAAFLGCKAGCPTPCAGDFAGLLAGWMPHWRVRECARVFASFCEMAYRRARGEVTGLYGGRLVLTPVCESPEAVAEIFTRKTGVR